MEKGREHWREDQREGGMRGGGKGTDRTAGLKCVRQAEPTMAFRWPAAIAPFPDVAQSVRINGSAREKVMSRWDSASNTTNTVFQSD
jgi:hypothetical protein